MVETLLGAGLTCLIAAIVGGGLQAFGIVLPVLGSLPHQLLLACLGIILVLAGLRPDLWRQAPSQLRPVTDQPGQEAMSDKVIKASGFYFGGRGGGLRVSDAEIGCESGKCEFGFSASTCAKEYLPTREDGLIVSIVLADSEGQDLTRIIRTITAWVRNKDDVNRISHLLENGWVSAAVWNKATKVVMKSGWQKRNSGAC